MGTQNETAQRFWYFDEVSAGDRSYSIRIKIAQNEWKANPFKLRICISVKLVSSSTLSIWLLSATRCSSVCIPLIPSKVRSPHRLTFKYLRFNSEPKSRNDSNELPSKFRAVSDGRKTFNRCKPNMLDESSNCICVIVAMSFVPTECLCNAFDANATHEKDNVTKTVD